jgi:ABC-type transport system involved in multi-copper enzyme maturation permease subunit
MARYGLSRAWSSLLVKLCLILAWGPALISAAAFGVLSYLASKNPGQMPAPDLGVYANRLSYAQIWLFMTATAVGAATGSIAHDRARGAFSFYFTKPVTPRQYLLGRAGAVLGLLVLVHALPCTLFAGLAMMLEDGTALLDGLRVLAVLWGVAMVSALSMTALSFAVSSVVATPTLAAFAFAALWFIPHMGSVLVSLASELEFVRFTSLPALLNTLAEPWLDASSEVPKLHSLLALALLLLFSALLFAFAELSVRKASAQG